MKDLVSYKRMWIWKVRHTPEAIATNEHRKLFKVFYSHWKKGKCVYCGVIKTEVPNHNCFRMDLDNEATAEFVARHFLQERLEE